MVKKGDKLITESRLKAIFYVQLESRLASTVNWGGIPSAIPAAPCSMLQGLPSVSNNSSCATLR